MSDIIVLHSAISGKIGPEESKKRIINLVETALGSEGSEKELPIAYVSNKEETEFVLTRIIEKKIPKIAISGGDGFAAVFANCFFKARAALKKEDYNPDVLFLASGTGNAISYCAKFKTPAVALKCLIENKYSTTPLNMLEVTLKKAKELTHFVSFGADGEILEIYKNQKLKGLLGYILSVFRYAFSRKLYNPFSRNDANYNLNIKKDGRQFHSGRYEGGGVSCIEYVGYGFKPYPLAFAGNAHMRFVLFGALLMPTMFNFTRWNFLKRPNRVIYDHALTEAAVLDFSFDRELHVQISGDNVEKQSAVRVEFTKDKKLNMVKRENS
ncbi:MAG: diacylglycerol kinase family protein [bacterium]